MRGFLHRIAAAALTPGPRVHPFVDSIYAAPRLQNLQAPPALVEEDVSLSSPGPSPLAAPSPAGSAPSRVAAPIRNQPDSNQIDPQMESHTRFQRRSRRAEAHSGQSPAGPVNQGEEALPSSPAHAQAPNESSARHLAEDFELDAGQRRLDTSAGAAAGKEPSDAGSPQAWRFTPIVSEDGWPAARSAPILEPPGPRLPPDRRSSARMDARQEAASAFAGPAPAQQDDIQIHIGRIEVVAVSPPAPRPAAPSHRKGPSLDEYLSRRNGRAR
jgi:hypothetical protein